ncbi:amino acid permease 3 [Setaria italica]|uniref:amino acid permease 3 n=1 Tax=Setaria italica TaxID=4555 RepID=UPI0006467EE0|nr:amino acid permease 3 [Setaria italica]
MSRAVSVAPLHDRSMEVELGTPTNGRLRGSLAGVIGAGARVTLMQKVWRSLQAFGNIAFAYGFSIILLEIQDTIKLPPPSEATVMKKATAVSVVVTTVIYLLCGCVGYAAFGRTAPDNMLTGFGFYEPFWLLDVANAFIGAVSFWPLTVYFPVEMYIAQRRVPRGTMRWLLLHARSAGCLVVSIAAAAGSVAGVVEELKAHSPFCWSC